MLPSAKTRTCPSHEIFNRIHYIGFIKPGQCHPPTVLWCQANCPKNTTRYLISRVAPNSRKSSNRSSVATSNWNANTSRVVSPVSSLASPHSSNQPSLNRSGSASREYPPKRQKHGSPNTLPPPSTPAAQPHSNNSNAQQMQRQQLREIARLVQVSAFGTRQTAIASLLVWNSCISFDTLLWK